MQFDHKAILKSDHIEKINGSVEKHYKIKIDACDAIISYYRLIDELQSEIKYLYDHNKNIENLYLESKASINVDDKRMSDEIGNMIDYKKELRDYYCKKIKELKKKYTI